MDVYPTRRQLLLKDFNNRSMTEQQIHEENLAIEESLGKLHNHMARRDAEQLEEMATFMQEFEAQKEEHRLAMEALQEEHRKELEELRKAREADKEALKKELLSMMKEAQGNEALHQGLVQPTLLNKMKNKLTLMHLLYLSSKLNPYLTSLQLVLALLEVLL
ncbi:hypothetical protein PVAP13_2KG196258 [Panicum virgatum]|uniref:Uncharacterized protein n=1 Tax=Panicum virgatum TaxID=38727 RepID=A0A8T0W4F2_PANVG|nr:hypothetical protein PVAP13_2KG196258 [Panicum virgatum]